MAHDARALLEGGWLGNQLFVRKVPEGRHLSSDYF
jgi:hypothetical protein